MIKVGIKWGINMGLALVLATQILTWLGLGTSMWFIIINYVVVIIFLTLGIHSFSKLHPQNFNFNKSLGVVLIIVLLSRFIFQTYMYVYTTYADPMWIDNVAETWSQQLIEAEYSQEAIEQNIQAFRNSYRPANMFTIEIIKYGIPQIIIGTVIALIFLWRLKRTQQQA